MKNKSKLQVEKLYRKIATQLCYLLLLEVCTHRYRGLHEKVLPMTKNQTRNVGLPSNVLLVLLEVEMICAYWPSVLPFCLEAVDDVFLHEYVL